MTALKSLDALAARIAAGSGPDREIDAEFARVVCGWESFSTIVFGTYATPPTGDRDRRLVPQYTDALAGPGALFAAARALWPEGMLHAAQSDRSASARAHRNDTDDDVLTRSHRDLCRALMLAITAAKRAEIAGGAT